MEHLNKKHLVKHVLFATLIFSFILVQAAQPGQPAKELSSSELKGLALVVSAENPEYSSLAIEAVFSEPRIKTAIGYRVFYSKTKGYALYVRDMMDETPIFLLAEKKALLFDPSEEELILFQDIGLMFELGMEGDELRFVSAFRKTKEGSKLEIINTVIWCPFSKRWWPISRERGLGRTGMFFPERQSWATCVVPRSTLLLSSRS
jgi:hypothetical protein